MQGELLLHSINIRLSISSRKVGGEAGNFQSRVRSPNMP